MLGIMNGCVFKLWLCISVRVVVKFRHFHTQKKKRKKDGYVLSMIM